MASGQKKDRRVTWMTAARLRVPSANQAALLAPG